MDWILYEFHFFKKQRNSYERFGVGIIIKLFFKRTSFKSIQILSNSVHNVDSFKVSLIVHETLNLTFSKGLRFQNFIFCQEWQNYSTSQPLNANSKLPRSL